MTDIFISYAKEDRQRARSLAEALTAAGNWSVFWDRSIPPGLSWFDVIGKELEQARCIFVAWSHASVQSDWVREEADEGKKRKVLIPVFLDQVEAPVGFRAIQGVDLSNWDGTANVPEFQLLLTAVKRVLGAGKEAAGHSHEQAAADHEAIERTKKAHEARERDAAVRLAQEELNAKHQAAERETQRIEAARREQEAARLAQERFDAERRAKEATEVAIEHDVADDGVTIGTKAGRLSKRLGLSLPLLAGLGFTILFGAYLFMKEDPPTQTPGPLTTIGDDHDVSARLTPPQNETPDVPPERERQPPTSPVKPAAERRASPPSAVPSPGPFRVGGDIKPPKKLVDVPPVYPPFAQAAGISGFVILEATIAKDGAVKNVRVLRSIALLDQAAIDAVAQWKYTPTLLKGQPVEVIMTVTVNFTLQ